MKIKKIKASLLTAKARLHRLNRRHCGQAVMAGKGFSLVELLVVISIIGILSALLTVNFMGARERARDAQKIQDLDAIKNALRSYYNDNQSYPTSYSDISPDYITNIPNHTYEYLPDGDSFTLTVELESGAGDEDIDSQVRCGIPFPVPGYFAVCAK